MQVRCGDKRFAAAIDQTVSDYNARKERENRLARRRVMLKKLRNYALLAGIIGMIACLFHCGGISALSSGKQSSTALSGSYKGYSSRVSSVSKSQGVTTSASRGFKKSPLDKAHE